MRIAGGEARKTEGTRVRESKAVGAAFGIALAAALALALLPAGVRAAGIKWDAYTVDQALARAKEKNRILMIDMYSTHCGQCMDMEEGLWNTKDGADLGDGLIAIKIASDQPEGIPVHRRYPILGLPAVLFIGPDGREIGRVLGYRDRADFIVEANALKAGIDPLPDMEKKLAAAPNDLAQINAVLEQYLFRKREADAQKLLDRIMELDKAHQSLEGVRALSTMAKYKENYLNDQAAALPLWKSIVELYPTNPGVASGVSGSLKTAVAWGQTQTWIDWICAIGEKYPNEGRLQYNIAIVAYHQGITAPCLGKAARRAIAQKIGPTNMPAIADTLEGKAKKK